MTKVYLKNGRKISILSRVDMAMSLFAKRSSLSDVVKRHKSSISEQLKNKEFHQQVEDRRSILLWK